MHSAIVTAFFVVVSVSAQCQANGFKVDDLPVPVLPVAIPDARGCILFKSVCSCLSGGSVVPTTLDRCAVPANTPPPIDLSRFFRDKESPTYRSVDASMVFETNASALKPVARLGRFWLFAQ